MSEPVHTSETPATDDTEQQQPAPEQQPEQKPTETVDYWKRMSRENEQRAKANADAARKLKEIEDRDLSELQKAQRDRDELAERLAATERDALRNRVALTKGLPPEVASILAGSSEEELTAHADALLAWRGNAPPPTPRPDPGQGARPSTPQSDEDAEYKRFFPNG